MPTDENHIRAHNGVPWITILSRLALIVLFIVLANLGVSWFVARLEVQIWPQHLELLDRTALVAIILYVGLMAIPFLPGIEIGMTFMMILGTKGIVVVYVCTLMALSISFWLGRWLPLQVLSSILLWLHLRRAAALLTEFGQLSARDRLEFLQSRVSTRPGSILITHRYLLIALLLNLPGNVVLGGGGGLGMMAGASRLYSFSKYFLVVSIAILPGPILIILSNRLL